MVAFQLKEQCQYRKHINPMRGKIVKGEKRKSDQRGVFTLAFFVHFYPLHSIVLKALCVCSLVIFSSKVIHLKSQGKIHLFVL